MKAYETYYLANQWKQITGISLRGFVEIMPNGDVVPDTEMLELWLKPDDDESIEDRLRDKYGQKAVDIIEKLFDN